MSSQLEREPAPELVESSSSALDKGKGKSTAASHQESTESTPLLASRSYVLPGDGDGDDDIESTILLLLSLAFSYAAQASRISNDDILSDSLVFHGPDAIDVLNISQHGDVWLRIDGRVGLDAGAIIDVKPGDDDSLWLGAWKAIGRLSGLYCGPPFPNTSNRNPPDDVSWLTPISVPVHIYPSRNITTWLEFVRDSWHSGYAVARATISHADVRGGSWEWDVAKCAYGEQIESYFWTARESFLVPALPNLPAPGDDLPLPSVADLVHLTHFSLTSGVHNLTIDASATIVNPLPASVSFTAPHFPFVIWIPAPSNDTTLVPLASVTSAPFSLTHPNITFSLNGSVLPISHSATPALSSLISDYLSGVDHPIAITTPSEFFHGYIAHTTFSAPHPRPEVLHNVTIESMKVHPSGTTIIASGIVHARLALPEGMDITISPSRVLPDALIFDGPLPLQLDPAYTFPPLPLPITNPDNDDDGDDDDAPPPAPPLPNPLPTGAFARVRPSAWLAALTAPTAPRRDWGERGNTTLRISARFADVPLEVLPGREREFRSFVGKVIWGAGDGAVAGVQGVVAVSVRVEGLPVDPRDGDGVGGAMVLTGLPFQGSVRWEEMSDLGVYIVDEMLAQGM
ncbi:hypothetical protein EDB92DRAFT_2114867 [Lactarius akahatsu]|uniref:Uncharacterized protein n=1 Tax=Lactarius akahatsu TaxID=416441 RepID=A0AAD4LIW1_9AGAM|nr:hypothetical protein EDB92DRAFT_2114867 [Lactarius akahatsu]